ncbi:hypothetical protein AB0I91_34820 [Actinosynnema sp. NPDC049800]
MGNEATAQSNGGPLGSLAAAAALPRRERDVGGQVIGAGGATEDADPAAGVLDHREHVEAGVVQGGGLEEVAGEERLGLRAELKMPSGRCHTWM